jgi:hypothetical protein
LSNGMKTQGYWVNAWNNGGGAAPNYYGPHNPIMEIR